MAGAGDAVGARAVVRKRGGGALRTDLGEPRAAADLDSPALVVGQMPVQRVVLVQRHQVDQLLNERHREKVARHVEVQAAPGKPRMVDNVDGRQRGGRVRFAGAGVRRRRPSQKLAQRLRAPQHAARRGAGDRGAARGYRERVAFVVQVGTRSIGGQRDCARWGGGAERVCAARLSAHGRQPGGQQAGRRAAVAVGQQRGVRGDRQRTGRSGHGHRTGDDRDPAHGVHSAPRCTARSYPVWVHASSPAADSATDAPHTPAAAPVAEYARCRAAVLARAGPRNPVRWTTTSRRTPRHMAPVTGFSVRRRGAALRRRCRQGCAAPVPAASPAAAWRPARTAPPTPVRCSPTGATRAPAPRCRSPRW